MGKHSKKISFTFHGKYYEHSIPQSYKTDIEQLTKTKDKKLMILMSVKRLKRETTQASTVN